MNIFKRYDKDKTLEYVDYLINYIYYKNFSKILEKLNILEKLKKIDIDLSFNQNETISYFTFLKVNNLAKQIYNLK